MTREEMRFWLYAEECKRQLPHTAAARADEQLAEFERTATKGHHCPECAGEIARLTAEVERLRAENKELQAELIDMSVITGGMEGKKR